MQNTAVDQVCYHCGSSMPTVALVYDEKPFCCAGCMGVYQILSTNNLCGYYQLDEHPGIKNIKSPRFDYLDEQSVAQQLISYRDDKTSIVAFYVPAIHCSSCIWLLEHLYRIHPAIFDSRINFLKREVRISFKHNEISLRQVVETLAKIGYEPKITLQDSQQQHKDSTTKSLILKIAVAGFCMGNVMLFSFPEYFGITASQEKFRALFAWINLAFSIPATFYCGRDYFISAFSSLKHRQVNLDTPLALIIAMLFLRTLYATIFATGVGFADTLTGLVFLLLIGKWIKQRTYHHISFDRDYRSYFPIAVTQLIGNAEKQIPLSNLAVGDRLLIRNGELVPADSMLVQGNAYLDMSFVTGEAEPQPKVLGEMLYAGGKQVGQSIEIVVMKVVAQSYLTGLWNGEAYKKVSHQHFNDRIAKYFTAAVLIFAFGALGFWLLQNQPERAWMAFTAVIIVACPCVLALSTPFTFSAILSIFDKHGFYVKDTDSVEQLARCKSMVFDKTGTLTVANQSAISFTGSLTAKDKQLVASVLRHSFHPLSRQILEFIRTTDYLAVDDFEEVPGKGLVATVNAQKIWLGAARFMPIAIGKGLNGSVHLVIDNNYYGYFTVVPQWRTGLGEMLLQLGKKFKLSLLSGDTDKDRQRLRDIFPVNTPMQFEQQPMDKLSNIQLLQSVGGKVVMLGDGLNDAGALKQADFGIAVTDDVSNFTPSCDAILNGQSLTKLPRFYKLATHGVTVVKWSFAIATAYNLIGLWYAIQGDLYPLVAAVLMPLSTVTIILFTTVATRFFAHKNQL